MYHYSPSNLNVRDFQDQTIREEVFLNGFLPTCQCGALPEVIIESNEVCCSSCNRYYK